MPTTQQKLVLYSTLGCHLCEHAKKIVLPVLTKHHLRLEEVDISDSDELMAEFGLLIPVLRFELLALEEKQAQLNWPFSEQDVEGLIKSMQREENL